MDNNNNNEDSQHVREAKVYYFASLRDRIVVMEGAVQVCTTEISSLRTDMMASDKEQTEILHKMDKKMDLLVQKVDQQESRATSEHEERKKNTEARLTNKWVMGVISVLLTAMIALTAQNAMEKPVAKDPYELESLVLESMKNVEE